MFDELQEVTDFKNVKQSSQSKDSSKLRSVFRAQVSIYDGAFLWIYWTAYYFRNKSSIGDVRLRYT